MPKFHEAEDEDRFTISNLTDTTTSPSGSDSMSGSSGSDSLTSPDGADTLTSSSADPSGSDLSGDDLSGDDSGNDTLSGGDDHDGNDSLTAGPGNDSVTGDPGNDSVTGDTGNDSITGATGNDSLSHHDDHDHHLLTGTAGADLFVVEDSAARNPESVFHVVDFTSGQDQIVFGDDLGVITSGDFATETADSYAAAFDLARADIRSGAADAVAVQVGADVVVFADTHDNNHVSGAVVLVGKTLGDIAPGDIV